MPKDDTKKIKKEINIEDIYKKKDPIEHVLTLPDTYIGSIQQDLLNMWVYDSENNMIKKQDISYVPGFYKTCDELIVNARDHQIRDKTCNIIKINIDKEHGCFSVWNNGSGVPIQIHKEYNVYIPELIFGHLMTSSNYDQKGKTVGGKNGLGAKVANIFSKKFIIETIDSETKKKYIQEFTENMSQKTDPIITTTKKEDESYTKISYYPDYQRFGMKGLTNDVISLLKKRAYDIAACTNKNVKVYLNDERIKVNSFEDFIKLHFEANLKLNLVYEEINPRWKIGVVFCPDDGNYQVSFVNGIWTYQGGTHVEYIANQIVKKVTDIINEKNKKLKIKSSQIKEHLAFFIDAVIDDPSFSSQTKGELTTKISNFGTTCEIDNIFIKKLSNTGLVDVVMKYAQLKEMSSLKQTDGKKVTSIRDISKLEDAHWAGGRKSNETRLILTEGDSAKSFAINGLEVIGRERFGVFPLKGKLLNVRNASAKQIKGNIEFCYLKKILGLKQNTVYTDTKKLRYGGIVLLTDSDVDGSHIKGLLINMFEYFWPELLKIKGFMQTLATPLIKTFKKTDTKKKNPEIFYTMTTFEEWAKKIGNDINKWNIKYYKGLGTSEDEEAVEAFKNFYNKVVSYIWEKPDQDQDSDSKNEKNIISIKNELEEETKNDINNDINNDDENDSDKSNNNKIDTTICKSASHKSIELAFDKNMADDRKKWLSTHNRTDVLEYDKKEVTYTEFINKDLIHFSNEDNIRSIPSLIDGLKPSQRKILYACFKKDQKTDIKVAQLSSYVAEHTAYKHGEKSLEETIVGMAQRFPGSNNIYLLYPAGNYGSRRQGGDDHAQSRYIFTHIEPITFKIFRKEDECILKYIEDEGELVEPIYYYPIVPMVLINGSHGIGTGFNTNVPSYNPLDICKNLLNKIDGKNMIEMDPWFYGFKGTLEKLDDKKYKVSGIFSVEGEDSVKVTELPIKGQNCWIENYSEFLNTLISDNKKVKNVISHCGTNKINFDIQFNGIELQKMYKKNLSEIEKFLKLSTTMSISSLYLYNENNKITHYDSPLEILEEFFEFRLKMYTIRKNAYLKILNNQLKILEYKIKFIEYILDKKIIIERKKKEEIIKKLEQLNFPKMSQNVDASEDDKTYRYLTDMQLFSLTEDKINELNDEYNKKKKEYDDYNSTTELAIWRRELIEFIETYKKWIIARDEVFEKDTNDKKNKSEKPKKSKNK